MVKRGGRDYRYGYWWVEQGGLADGIHDTEHLKLELLKIILGVWDHVKNTGDHEAENFRLEWIQFLPGKRESRRLIGDYVLTQNDCLSANVFPDTVAYGGWYMDNHDPGGFHTRVNTTVFHETKSPYTIPYRCLYSRNVVNLMMAGRNISATHMALSSTRVMATCAVLGQAAGTAAALACSFNTSPRAIGSGSIAELQQHLLANDCYLPGFRMMMPEIAGRFKYLSSSGDPSSLTNGVDRITGKDNNFLALPKNGWLELISDSPHMVGGLDIVFDSDLSTQIITMEFTEEYESGYQTPPATLATAFRLSFLTTHGWSEQTVFHDNCRRHVRIPINRSIRGVRLDNFETIEAGTHPNVRIFRANLW